jgi:MFS family permease
MTAGVQPTVASGARRLSRDVQRMVVAQGASTLGDGAAMVTLILRLHNATHSSWLVASLLFAMLGPSVVGAPIAAGLVRRLGPGRAFVTATGLQAVAAAGLAAVSGPVPTLALATGIGAGFALTQPAALTLLPRLVADEGITSANSLLRSADWIGWTAGQLIAGGLLTVGLREVPLLIDSVSFLAAAVLIAGIGPAAGPEPRAEHGETGQAGGTAGSTLRGRLRRLGDAGSDRQVRALLLIAGLSGLFVPMSVIAEVFLARDVLRASDFGYTTMGAAFTAGMVVGTLLAPKLGGREALTVAGSLILAGAGIAVVGLVGTVQLTLLPYAVAGLAVGVQLMANRSMLQRYLTRQVRPELHPDIYSGYVAATMGAQLAGFACGAALLGVAGARPVMWVAGGGTALVGAIGWLRWPSRAQEGSAAKHGPATQQGPADPTRPRAARDVPVESDGLRSGA